MGYYIKQSHFDIHLKRIVILVVMGVLLLVMIEGCSFDDERSRTDKSGGGVIVFSVLCSIQSIDVLKEQMIVEVLDGAEVLGSEYTSDFPPGSQLTLSLRYVSESMETYKEGDEVVFTYIGSFDTKVEQDTLLTVDKIMTLDTYKGHKYL